MHPSRTVPSGSRSPASSTTWQARGSPRSGRWSAAIIAAGSISPCGNRSVSAGPSGMNFGCQATTCLLSGTSFQRGLEVKYVYLSMYATRSPVTPS